jgi:hypothetical protein
LTSGVIIAIPEISGRLPISEVRQYVKTECEHYSVPLPTDFDTKYVDLKKAYATSGSREALNELRAIAKQRGGKCLSDVYVDYSTPLWWECLRKGVGVGPRQVIELMDQFWKKRPVFGLRMAIWAFKLP